MKRSELKRSQIKAGKTKRLSEYDAEFAKSRKEVISAAGKFCCSDNFMPANDIEAFNAFDPMLVSCLITVNHVHHRKTRAQGGTNNPENLVALCGNCHRYIHDHPSFGYKYGLLLHTNDSEALPG